MRKRATESFFQRYIGGSRAPWNYAPFDEGMIVVSASRPQEALHPGNTEGLLLRSNNGWPLVPVYVRAIETAIISTNAATNAPPRYLDAANYWLGLLSRRRDPTNDAERRLVELYPSFADPLLSVSIAAIRPDESIESFDRGAWPNSQLYFESIIWTSEVCEYPSPSQLPPEFRSLAIDSANYGKCDLFNWVSCKCSFDCYPEPNHDEQGMARCVAEALVDPSETCDRPGWRPTTHTERTFEETSFGRRRVCEIRQLEGAALESCVFDYDCADCEPGFCVTQSTAEGEWCVDSDTTKVGTFRFPFGVDQGVGMLRLTCELPEYSR
jgi:hypothetical protein